MDICSYVYVHSYQAAFLYSLYAKVLYLILIWLFCRKYKSAQLIIDCPAAALPQIQEQLESLLLDKANPGISIHFLYFYWLIQVSL